MLFSNYDQLRPAYWLITIASKQPNGECLHSSRLAKFINCCHLKCSSKREREISSLEDDQTKWPIKRSSLRLSFIWWTSEACGIHTVDANAFNLDGQPCRCPATHTVDPTVCKRGNGAIDSLAPRPRLDVIKLILITGFDEPKRRLTSNFSLSLSVRVIIFRQEPSDP